MRSSVEVSFLRYRLSIDEFRPRAYCARDLRVVSAAGRRSTQTAERHAQLGPMFALGRPATEATASAGINRLINSARDIGKARARAPWHRPFTEAAVAISTQRQLARQGEVDDGSS